MIALYFHAQLWSMKDIDVLCLHFAVNYRYLMCQSKHILDMLGSSEKCTEALKTDINLFFTITNCQIARSCSLTRRMNFKFVSVRILTRKISQ